MFVLPKQSALAKSENISIKIKGKKPSKDALNSKVHKSKRETIN